MKPSSSDGASLIPASAPLVVVLSGPSGTGKDAVLGVMKARGMPLAYVVTNTTRPHRNGEIDNINYHFVSQHEFNSLVEKNELLEHARVYGYSYGVPKAPVRKALEEGKDVILKVDVQGAMTIKKNLPGAVLIFLMPPSLEELAQRLKGRNTETARDLEVRLATARSEIEKLPEFDYVVVGYSGELERAVDEIAAIITAEKRRVAQRECSL